MIKYSLATNFSSLVDTYSLGCLHFCTFVEDMLETTDVIEMEMDDRSMKKNFGLDICLTLKAWFQIKVDPSFFGLKLFVFNSDWKWML